MSPRSILAGPPHTFAHRGGSGCWPENTLAAFEGALALGVSHIESDLHLSRDGVIVVFHDDRVDRTTDGAGQIRDLTLSEIQRLDAGYRFRADGGYPYRGKGLEIPTLVEVLERFQGVRLNLEIKQREPNMVRQVWELIEERGLHDQILIAAAQDSIVQEFRRVSGGRVATSAGTVETSRFWAATRFGLAGLVDTPYDALQVPVREGPMTIVDRCLIGAAHKLGLQVHVWTIDNAEEMTRLWQLGVDGLMSDRPDILVGRTPGGRDRAGGTSG